MQGCDDAMAEQWRIGAVEADDDTEQVQHARPRPPGRHGMSQWHEGPKGARASVRICASLCLRARAPARVRAFACPCARAPSAHGSTHRCAQGGTRYGARTLQFTCVWHAATHTAHTQAHATAQTRGAYPHTAHTHVYATQEHARHAYIRTAHTRTSTTRTRARTHAFTHACTHARTHARTCVHRHSHRHACARA